MVTTLIQVMGERLPKSHLFDAIAGCLLGGAIGDAAGAAHEGGDVDHNREVELTRPTDDTWLSLATAQAIIGGVDPDRIAQNFVARHKEGRLNGAGGATLGAVRALEGGGHWALVGRRGEHAAGNGAAMRMAPLAFVLDPREPAARTRIRDIARITHHSDEAYAAALLVALAVHNACSDGRSFDELLGVLPDSNTKDVFQTLLRRRPESVRAAAEITGTSAYAPESVPLAVYLAVNPLADFKTTIRDIVREGGDCDTIASIYGQVAGTKLGCERLPADLLAAVPNRADLTEAARALATVVQDNL